VPNGYTHVLATSEWFPIAHAHADRPLSTAATANARRSPQPIGAHVISLTPFVPNRAAVLRSGVQ